MVALHLCYRGLFCALAGMFFSCPERRSYSKLHSVCSSKGHSMVLVCVCICCRSPACKAVVCIRLQHNNHRNHWQVSALIMYGTFSSQSCAWHATLVVSNEGQFWSTSEHASLWVRCIRVFGVCDIWWCIMPACCGRISWGLLNQISAFCFVTCHSVSMHLQASTLMNSQQICQPWTSYSTTEPSGAKNISIIPKFLLTPVFEKNKTRSSQGMTSWTMRCGLAWVQGHPAHSDNLCYMECFPLVLFLQVLLSGNGCCKTTPTLLCVLVSSLYCALSRSVLLRHEVQ